MQDNRALLDRAAPPGKGRTRRVLLIGFGGLLSLMALAGGDAILILRQIRSDSENIRRTFLIRNQALERVRSAIVLSGTYVRDYLLAPEPVGAEAERDAIDTLHAATDLALQAYSRSLDPAGGPTFHALATEVDSYWQILDPIFRWTEEQKRTLGFAYFYEELAPRRIAMLQLADRVSTLNEQELSAGESKLVGLFDRFRSRLLVMLLGTLAGGLILATITIGHMLRLENEARLRYEESQRAQAELQELSARVVKAQEDERRNISRELHDEVGQSLSALLMEAGNAAAMAPSSTELRAHLESMKHLAENAMNVVRNMTLLLRPSMLDDFGLVPALSWQARETAKRTGLRIHVNAGEVAEDLPDDHKTCIYRVVQEALHNIARHSGAKTVDITVQQDSDKIRLTIQDDGHGFDARTTRGLGLLGMEERVRHLGGAFEVASEVGHGTRLEVELPLAAVEAGKGSGQ